MRPATPFMASAAEAVRSPIQLRVAAPSILSAAEAGRVPTQLRAGTPTAFSAAEAFLCTFLILDAVPTTPIEALADLNTPKSKGKSYGKGIIQSL